MESAVALISSFRPAKKPARQTQPTTVTGTVQTMAMTPVDGTVTTTGEGLDLPAFFVETTGSDNNDGQTKETAFLTLTKARDAMRADASRTRVYIGGGTYPITSSLSLTSSDSSTEWLAYPGETPIVDGQNADIKLFSCDGANDLTFRGIKFINTDDSGGAGNGAGAALYFTNSLRPVIVQCAFDAVFNGIYLASGSNNAKILENSFDNIIGTGVGSDGSSGHTLAGNTGDNIGTNNVQGAGNAWFWGRNCQNCLFEYNTLTNCHYLGISFAGVGANNSGNTIRFGEVIGYCTNVNDGGAVYTLGRTGNYDDFLVNDCWFENGGNATNPHAKALYWDDGTEAQTGGKLVTGKNCVGVNGFGGFTQIHGGNDTLIENSIALLVVGTGVSQFEDRQYGMWFQGGGIHDVGMTGNIGRKNIWQSINASLARVEYTGSNSWRRGTISTPTLTDNVRWQNFAAAQDETSGVNQDPNFDNYDLANKILELNAASPAYTEGFVDIAGVTDGGAYTWGSPTSNPNSGYVEANYL